MKLVTVAQMREIEKAADAKGLSYAKMMENAGQGLAELITSIYLNDERRSVMGLVGSGNNGGDTLVALASLAKMGWPTCAYIARPRPAEDPLIERLVKAGGQVCQIADDPKMKKLDEWLSGAQILLDGILGTGTRLPLEDDLANLLDHISEFEELPEIIAVDCPSGADCDTGEVAAQTLYADYTVCMAAVKTGLVTLPAFDRVGELVTIDIGLPEKLKAWNSIDQYVADEDSIPLELIDRPSDAHKGTFGTAMVVAGSINYTGAALLSGQAAYRVGAGLVRLAVPAPLHSALAGHLPEATWLILRHEMGVIAADAVDVLIRNLDKVTAMLLGPGWGVEDTTGEFLRRLLEGKVSRAAHPTIGFVTSNREDTHAEPVSLPALVIDADGLKLLSKIADWPAKLPANTILTPHPGEMAVLTGVSVEEIQSHRQETAIKYAKEWGHIVVLKGALTVVAAPDGSSTLIPVATAALARAGTGDVLSGIIVGLLAQGIPADEAAVAGAYIHGLAGLFAEEALGGSAPVLAGDVLEMIPEVLTDF